MHAENYIANFDLVKSHILACYPNEGGGFVTSDNIFHPVENCSETPGETYEFPVSEFVGHDVKCILHSHVYDQHNPPGDDPRIPSKTDMEGQVRSGVEWAIVVTEGENVTEPYFWGDYDHRPDLWNREFIHNMQDCLGFMSDWQYKEFGLKLPFQPRNFDWFQTGENFIENVVEPWGFVDVSHLPQAKGDVIFYQVESKVPNHLGVVVEDGVVAHQLYGRFPKTEPYAKWHKYVTRRVRHSTNPAFK